MIKYKGKLIMNDGAIMATFNYSTVEEVKKELQNTLKTTTRYFKRNGVDYGERGKVFTYDEEHNGVKRAVILKVVSEEFSDITSDLK